MKDALGLEEPLAALKDNETGDANQHGAEVSLSQVDKQLVLANEGDKGFTEKRPEKGHRCEKDGSKERAFLEILAK